MAGRQLAGGSFLKQHGIYVGFRMESHYERHSVVTTEVRSIERIHDLGMHAHRPASAERGADYGTPDRRWNTTHRAGITASSRHHDRDEIEELFARRQAAWDHLDAAALAADYSDDCVVDTPSAGLPLRGRAANEALLRKTFEAFPDLHRGIDSLLIDGNRVAEFGTSTGTDIGGFMELPPTGRAFRIPIVFLYILKDGHIIRERRIADFTGMLVQVGIRRSCPSNQPRALPLISRHSLAGRPHLFGAHCAPSPLCAFATTRTEFAFWAA